MLPIAPSALKEIDQLEMDRLTVLQGIYILYFTYVAMYNTFGVYTVCQYKLLYIQNVLCIQYTCRFKCMYHCTVNRCIHLY